MRQHAARSGFVQLDADRCVQLSDHFGDGGKSAANGVHEPTLVANHARATASPRRTGPATQRDGTPLRRSVRRSGRKKSGEIVVH